MTMRYLLQILVFAIFIVLNNANEIINNERTENDSFESETDSSHEVEKYEKTSLVYNFTPTRKRDIASRKRRTSGKLKLLKIPDWECTLHIQVKKRPKRGEDLECDNSKRSDAASMYLSRNKGKDRYVNSCVICDASFCYDKDYMNHCEETHGNLYPYRCPHCERKFKWKRNLKQHVDQKHDEKENLSLLRWNNEESRGITCETCGERQKNWIAFEHHTLSKHENKRMMACPYCPKKYFRRGGLLAHVRSKHDGRGGDDEGEGEGEGEVEGEVEGARKLFRKRDFQPTDCAKGHKTYCEEKRPEHQEQIGNVFGFAKIKMENEDDPKLSHNAKSIEQNRNDLFHHEGMGVKGKRKNAKIYACPHCNLNVIGLKEYEKHGVSMHKDLPLYRCEECHKGFFHQCTMNIHYKEKHDNDKIRCSSCSKCYSNLGALRQHEYACKRKALNAAKHKEQGLPSYTCHICEREFYMKWKSFKNHVKRHEKYVYCHICKQGFNKFNSKGLAEHLRVRHPLLENIGALLKMAAQTKVKCENFNE